MVDDNDDTKLFERRLEVVDNDDTDADADTDTDTNSDTDSDSNTDADADTDANDQSKEHIYPTRYALPHPSYSTPSIPLYHTNTTLPHLPHTTPSNIQTQIKIINTSQSYTLEQKLQISSSTISTRYAI